MINGINQKVTKKLVLVTGAGGFIGSHLTYELVRRGYKIKVLIKRNETLRNLQDLVKMHKVEVIKGDLLDKNSLKKACEDVDVVFHIAAKTDLATKSYEPYYETNYIGTKNLVESCKGNLKKFVFFSSMLAVGLPNSRRKINENYVGKPQSYYGLSKRIGEEYLLSEFKKRKFPVVILRPTSVYGPKERIVLSGLFKVIKEGMFVMIGDGENLVSYVYVGNVVDAAIKSSRYSKTSGQIYFISDKKTYKFKEIIKEIYKVLNKREARITVPFFLAYIGSYCYERLSRLIGKKPIIYPYRVKTLVLNYPCSIKKAERDFGYNPKINLAEGIKRTRDWYMKEGYI